MRLGQSERGRVLGNEISKAPRRKDQVVQGLFTLEGILALFCGEGGHYRVSLRSGITLNLQYSGGSREKRGLNNGERWERVRRPLL